MFRARALLESTETLSSLLLTVRAQDGLHLDIPVQSLLPDAIIRPSQSLQVHGLGGSGKTHVLYFLVIEAVLGERAVIVFDNDLKWDNSRLLQLLMHRLIYIDDVAAREIKAMELLDLVYIYQPALLTEFQKDIDALKEACVRDLPNHAVRYVMVDSMSAFHWQSLSNKTIGTVDVYLALKKQVEAIGAMLVYTTWDLGFQYMNMPNTVRLLMQKKYVLQFTQGLEQAVETREHRMEVIKRGICYLTSEYSTDRKTFIIKPDTCYFEVSGK